MKEIAIGEKVEGRKISFSEILTLKRERGFWNEYLEEGYNYVTRGVSAFHKHYQMFCKAVAPIILVPLYKPEKRVVDLGIGDGQFEHYLTSFLRGGVKIIGIDIASVKQFSNSVCFINGDGRWLPLRTGSVYLFMSSLTLNYFPYKGWIKALREIFRVIEPGGYFVFSVLLAGWNFKRVMIIHTPLEFLKRGIHLLYTLIKGSPYLIQIDKWVQEGTIEYPFLQDLKNVLKLIGFQNIEVIGRPFYGCAVIIRCRK